MARDVIMALPVLAAAGFWGYCLVDFARTPEEEMRTWPRPVWVAVLVFGSLAGGLLWLVLGRPESR